MPKKKIQLPAKSDPAFALLAEADGQRSPSANRFRVSDFADVLEVEPNENRTKVPVPDVTPPMAFNGIIQDEEDIDYFTFMKKGQRLITAHVRSLRLLSILS